MKTRNLIGKITLEEKINLIKSKKHTNALIIDVPNPLASYYSDFAAIQNPNSIVVATKKPNSFESILRATQKINSENNLNLRGAKCETQIQDNLLNGILSQDKTIYGIRIKGIENYTDIDDVISLYEQEGFDFNAKTKMAEELVRLRVNKFFDVEELENDLYRSKRNPDRYYFKMKTPDNYESCRAKVKFVKNNVEKNNFDAAHVIFYNNGKIDDMVRVIKPNFKLEEVKGIQQKYNQI